MNATYPTYLAVPEREGWYYEEKDGRAMFNSLCLVQQPDQVPAPKFKFVLPTTYSIEKNSDYNRDFFDYIKINKAPKTFLSNDTNF